MPLPESVRNRKIYLRAEELPADVREYMVKMLTVQIQSEYSDAPDRSGSVCPTVEDKAWLDLQIADEKRHGLGVSQMLRDMGVDPMPYIKEAESSVTVGGRKLDFFRMRMEDWVERSMTRVLAERTGGIQSVAGLGASYVPLAVWHARNYVDEAQGHALQGNVYAKRLIAEGRRDECIRAMEKFYPTCLDIFGGVDTPNEARYRELGIKTLSNNQSRLLWITTLERDLNDMGLEIPAGRWKGVRREYPPETMADTGLFLEPEDIPADARAPYQRVLAGWVQASFARQNEMAVFAAPTPEEKLALGIQYREARRWGLEAAQLLRRLGVDPNPVADEAERTQTGGKYKVDFLKQPMPATWAEICFHQLVAARLAQVASLALFGSSLIPLGVWAGRHYEAQEALANLWLARAAGLDRSVARDVGQPVVDACFPYALDAFGGDDTPSEETYCNSGVKTAANSHVRRIFVDVMGRDLAGLGLKLPDPTRGVRGTYKR